MLQKGLYHLIFILEANTLIIGFNWSVFNCHQHSVGGLAFGQFLRFTRSDLCVLFHDASDDKLPLVGKTVLSVQKVTGGSPPVRYAQFLQVTHRIARNPVIVRRRYRRYPAEKMVCV